MTADFGIQRVNHAPMPNMDKIAEMFRPGYVNPSDQIRRQRKESAFQFKQNGFTTWQHDRLQAKFGLLNNGLFRLDELFSLIGWDERVPNPLIDDYFEWEKRTKIVLEKPVTVSKYHQGNLWRMDAVIETPHTHIIVEIKPCIDSMGELLGQCQRYMRHYRPGYLQDGEFCPVLIACPVIPDWIIEVIEAQGFYWLANERWNSFFGVGS